MLSKNSICLGLSSLLLSANVVAAADCAAYNFGTGVVAGTAGTPCSSGVVLPGTASGNTCSVKCDTNYVALSSDATITCANGASAGASVSGAPTCVAQCAAISFGNGGVEAGASSGCSDGQQLAAAGTCTVKCGADYTVTSDVTITCASDATAGAGATAMPTCTIKQLCSDEDTLTCATGLAVAAGVRCAGAACTSGEFGDASKACCVAAADCAAYNFGTGVVAGTAGTPCSSGVVLPGTASGNTCSVKCDKNYVALSSDATITCANGASAGASVSGAPTCVAQCAAISFGNGGVEAGASSGCSDGQQLAAAGTCTVKCGADYTVTSDVTITCASDANAGAGATAMPTCTIKQLCSDEDTLTCATGLAVAAGVRCAGAECASSDFGDTSKVCCKRMCDNTDGGSTDFPSSSCSASSKIKTSLSGVACAGATCASSDCCDQATCAQITDGSSGGAFDCGSGFNLKSSPAGINCGQTACLTNSDLTEKTKCCNANELCSDEDTLTCATGLVVPAGVRCAGAECASSDFGDTSKVCCKRMCDNTDGSGTDFPSSSCSASSKLKTSLSGVTCAGATCISSDCCDQATCAQITDGSSGGAFDCGSGFNLKSSPAGINCGQTACLTNSDLTEKTKCCVGGSCKTFLYCNDPSLNKRGTSFCIDASCSKRIENTAACCNPAANCSSVSNPDTFCKDETDFVKPHLNNGLIESASNATCDLSTCCRSQVCDLTGEFKKISGSNIEFKYCVTNKYITFKVVCRISEKCKWFAFGVSNTNGDFDDLVLCHSKEATSQEKVDRLWVKKSWYQSALVTSIKSQVVGTCDADVGVMSFSRPLEAATSFQAAISVSKKVEFKWIQSSVKIGTAQTTALSASEKITLDPIFCSSIKQADVEAFCKHDGYKNGLVENSGLAICNADPCGKVDEDKDYKICCKPAPLPPAPAKEKLTFAEDLSSASSLRTAGSLCLASFGILMSILRIF